MKYINKKLEDLNFTNVIKYALYSLLALAILLLHLGFQPSSRIPRSPFLTQLDHMLVECNVPKECQSIKNLIKREEGKNIYETN